ncbi:MAG: hypothetical protein FWG90_00985 [Oscillospiraceae bacterium]|nr:hypothetical protein [Oscillospiraceae bacterium]
MNSGKKIRFRFLTRKKKTNFLLWLTVIVLLLLCFVAFLESFGVVDFLNSRATIFTVCFGIVEGVLAMSILGKKQEEAVFNFYPQFKIILDEIDKFLAKKEGDPLHNNTKIFRILISDTYNGSAEYNELDPNYICSFQTASKNVRSFLANTTIVPPSSIKGKVWHENLETLTFFLRVGSDYMQKDFVFDDEKSLTDYITKVQESYALLSESVEKEISDYFGTD